jgi:hypothetical protein
MQPAILFLVSIEQGTSRRVYRLVRGCLNEPVEGVPCRFLARPGRAARRCRRTDARCQSEARAGLPGTVSRRFSFWLACLTRILAR